MDPRVSPPRGGFLYAGAIPLHALASKGFRKRLEGTFWISFTIGLVPGICWLFFRCAGTGCDWGFRPDSLGWIKAIQLRELVGGSAGWIFALSVALGLFAGLRSERDGESVSPIDLTWPVVPSLLLGYTDPINASLSLPGMMFLSAFGFRYAGKVFVSKTEQKLIPTLLVLLLGYHAFFSGLPTIRERQSHSLEVASLAKLVVEKVPPGDPIALFRLEPLLGYLNALLPEKRWTVVLKTDFPPDAGHASTVLSERFKGKRSVWVDRKRATEPGAGLGSEYVEEWFESISTDVYYGEHSAELARIKLTPLGSNRGKRTSPKPTSPPLR